ncbi:sensor histidine kinase [Sphingomonas oligophenolica]|uniref:histidine kinase n=1 Tax=Sphingomonas oligophenolica TaxID=301154 RepID=A0A502CNT8_9SPHN|nr:ATP-binding protein [Sphingomonas oligophenolica]TPG14314.1 HAMP domain-containing protein [Sphingomonas oligophenolica]
MADLRRSAAYRIAFTYSAVFALAITLLGAVVYFAADAAFRAQQDAALAEETRALVRSYREEGLPDLLETILARETGGRVDNFGYALFDAGHRRIAGSLALRRPARGWGNVEFVDPVEGVDAARALTTAIGDGRTLVVAIDTEALERIDGTILALFGAALVLVLLFGTGGALALGGYLQRRLARISGTAQAIVAGDLARRIPVGARGDEFDELARSLNAMLDRIAQLLDSLRQVSSDVAHDLRTPLARLRAEIEAALDGPHAAQRGALEGALERSDELLSLFAAILRISEVEGGALARAFAPMDLSALANDLCDTYAPAVADGGRSLDCAIASGLTIHGDRELIAQAVINLLDNAQGHTPAGTSITVSLMAEGDMILLAVVDDGPGVAAKDRTRIVHRFVRLDSSRTRPGNGLGLNMVAAIAAVHRGTLSIDDDAPGLRATLRLPRIT